jgi:hypothetical protein
MMTEEELKAIAERCERDDEKWGGVGLSYPDVFQMMGDRRHLLAEIARLREECHDAKAERAHYGDIVTSRLGALENENERLKANLERCEQQCDALSEDSFYVADTMKKNDELLAEIERLREELATRQWASVVDRMPPNKAPVIMATFWGGVFDGLWDADAGEWYMGTTRMPSITHWMPLPEPPEEAARD